MDDVMSVLTHTFPHNHLQSRDRLTIQPEALCLNWWFVNIAKEFEHRWHRMTLSKPGVLNQHNLKLIVLDGRKCARPLQTNACALEYNTIWSPSL